MMPMGGYSIFSFQTNSRNHYPLQFVLSKEGAECFKSSLIAGQTDIHANNKIGMPSYSKQSYGSTVSYKKNSSGNGFQFTDKQYQGSSNYNRRSQSQGNSTVRKSYEKQDQKQVGGEHQRIHQ